MMKLVLLAVCVAFAGATFQDFLTSLQGHGSFQRLSASEKLLFGELVVAAENDELREFIDRTGLIDVLKLMDHMSSSDAEKFSAYLAEHSNYTHHAPDHGDVINKRQFGHHHGDHGDHGAFSDYLNDMHSSYFDRLPSQEEQTLDGLIKAVEGRQLTQYIEQVGYGPIFGLLEHLDREHAEDVTRMIEGVLAAEAGNLQVGKRQEEHHSHLYSYLSHLNTQYYEHLPEAERQTYHALMDATKAGTLTAYINTNGYGAIFGFLEQLDSRHANQAYDYIEKALASEAAAAAQN